MSLTIMIVDDEENFRKHTEDYLKGRGFEGRSADAS
jgi:FixJ family two-component response regulator